MKKYNFKEKWICSSIVIFLSFFLVFICGPIEVYFQNIIDFDFMLSDFIVFPVIGVIIGTAVFTTITSLFSSKIFKGLVSIILSFDIVSYLQYLFLNRGIATTDGTLVDWSEKTKVSIIYTSVYIIMFIIIFVIIILQKKNWKNVVIYVTLGLIIINASALISNVISIISAKKSIPHCQISADNQFEIAPQENVIIIVLDAMGNQTYEKYNEKYPELSECLHDFTYYNNYDSLYIPTNPSVSHILTGYDPSVSFSKYQWAEKAWNSDVCNQFFDSLHSCNYTFNIYIDGQGYVFGNINNLEGKIDNIESASHKTNYKLMIPMMLKYSIYRYAPYTLKERFEVNPNNFRGCVEYSVNDNCVEDNNEFREILAEKKLSINKNWKNAIVIEHLNGMHRNENDNLKEEEYYISSMNAVDEYISQLKMINKYDDSTIIVCSDHGSHEIDMDRQAIFFIKYPSESHDSMIKNSAPISSDDFQATIIDLIGEDYSDFGERISDWNEGDKRERTTYITSNELPSGLWGYTYYTDRYELMKTMEDGFDEKCPGKW